MTHYIAVYLLEQSCAPCVFYAGEGRFTKAIVQAKKYFLWEDTTADYYYARELIFKKVKRDVAIGIYTRGGYVRRALHYIANGLYSGYPLCCTLYFTYLTLTGVLAGKYSGEDDKDVDYVRCWLCRLTGYKVKHIRKGVITPKEFLWKMLTLKL